MMLPQPAAQVQHAPCSQRAREIVAATLILEAGGEGAVGMQAVFNVILNRASGDPRLAERVCLVPFAFAPWTGRVEESVIDRARGHPCWALAMMMTEVGLQGNLQDITGGANHFYDPKHSHPSWAEKMVRTKVIGGHIFLKER